jgi:L-threonylcarbamoyladenylate synthase
VGAVNVSSGLAGELHTTRILRADEDGIAEAARIILAGGLVAFPTETVYGLGADATKAEAIARLYEAKERPSFNPLIAHLSGIATARHVGKFNEAALLLAEKFWPGPLTLVLPATDDCQVCELARAELPTVAIRVPAHPVAHALLKAVHRPVAAPSANHSGHVSPTTADHVMTDLRGRIDAVLDGGPAQLGLESTIIDCTRERPVLLRPGTISRAAIEAVLAEPLGEAPPQHEGAPAAPGQLPSHYATRAKLRLDAAEVLPGEALLAVGEPLPKKAKPAAQTRDHSPKGGRVEAAGKLFAPLRGLDATHTP